MRPSLSHSWLDGHGVTWNQARHDVNLHVSGGNTKESILIDLLSRFDRDGQSLFNNTPKLRFRFKGNVRYSRALLYLILFDSCEHWVSNLKGALTAYLPVNNAGPLFHIPKRELFPHY